MAEVARLRSENHWFRQSDISWLYDALFIPRPSNLSREIAQLTEASLMLQKPGDPTLWSLTPRGRTQVADYIGELDPGAIEALIQPSSGALFGKAIHTVVPPSFAPVKWVTEIERFLADYPFERNVFLMTRFPKDEEDETYLDPVRDLIDVARCVLAEAGLVLHLASDRNIIDDLFSNVAAHMWSASYGIGLLENRVGRGLNYNVMTELGAMLMTGRRCALMKDQTAGDLPTDLSGHIYKAIDFGDGDEFEAELRGWVSNDLGLQGP